ncbi:MAG: Holliday junction resolvase Hjc, partial [archaeon]
SANSQAPYNKMIKNKKQKGSNAERELIRMLWARGYACVRAAGSGSTTFPSPDIIASNGKSTLAFECKSFSADYVHLEHAQIAQLVEFSQTFGADPWVAVRYEGRDWVFLDMARIQKTAGENFKVSQSFAYDDGHTFDQLIARYEKLENYK